jgi:hypothetical protein
MQLLWIPLIAVVIWVIANVARGFQAGQKPPPPVGPRPRRQRASNADIERFLEDVQRRRQQQGTRTVEAVPAEPRENAKRTPPRPRPETRTPRRVEPPPVVAELVTPLPVVLEAIPIDEPPPGSMTVVGRLETKPSTPPSSLPRVASTPHLLTLREMLHSAQGMRTAIVLNEIFNLPRSKRPRQH